MHVEEAFWIRSKLDKYSSGELSPLLNIGSSTNKFRSIDQPHIDNEIFKPLIDREIKVFHSDIKEADGVDLVGDITDERFRGQLKQLNISSVVCSNMLEHVVSKEVITKSILEILKGNGIIIVTVPYKYPKHLDPIDTMYRPSPKNITTLFSGTELCEEEIVNVGKPITSLLGSPFKLMFLILRSLIPFYKYSGWVTSINKLMFLFRTRYVSCVVLRKIWSLEVAKKEENSYRINKSVP